MNPVESSEKHLQENTIQTTAQNLTSESAAQSTQNVIQSNMHNVQAMIGTPTQLLGKSVSLDLSPKLSIRKPGVPVTIHATTAVDTNKITTTICSVGSTVRILSPNILHTVERQTVNQQPAQQTQQIVTSIPPTYHVPRGPAAVANISAPRAAVATPIVRSSTSHSVHVSRPGVNSTVSNPQWQSKTSVVYAQTQRYPIPSVSRVTTRTSTTVYSGPQPRLVTPTQGRSVQATVVTGVPGTPSRLIAPVLQTTSNVTRLSITPGKATVPQVTSISQAVQSGRSQTVQHNQTSKSQNNIAFGNRVAVSTPAINTTNKIVTVTSIQPTGARQLAINTVPGSSAGNLSRIVIPPPQAPQQATTARVVQTVASLSNFATVPRTITTTASVTSATRVAPPGSTTVTRITSMSLHPLPLSSTTRTLMAPVKVAQASGTGFAMQLKQPVQQVTPKTTSVSSTTSSVGNTQPVTGQYLQPPNTTTYYSFDPTGNYSQFRQAAVQPMRLLVETGYEESHNKTNSSPRPSILRKREHDSSPAKGAVKNLVPVLACMSSNVTPSNNSPPGSPTGDQDAAGCQSSGSTTVSATSSPGLDEPEQSRIPINQNVEMSPRKKPRKQQLMSVELSESRCTDEEMQFIVEEKVKKEIPGETREKIVNEKKMNFGNQDDAKQSAVTQPSNIVPIRTKPVPSLLGSAWKNKYGGRLHHYRRPSDVRPREERKMTVNELAQQKHVLQKLNGWKVFHLTTQMEDLAELEKQVHEKLKATLAMLEARQSLKNRQDDGLERVNELIKGNMQRSSLISEGMCEARTQLVAIFQHKDHVSDILQRCGNKRSQKKRDK